MKNPMNIAVLNGSPKGPLSVTMQYVRYLEQRFPQHRFEILDVARRIGRIVRDEETFRTIMDTVEASDGILWAFPLYVCLVPSQYKHFIELIRERKAEGAFHGKYAGVLTTSIHFFDHTAHEYMHAICDDLEMKYVGMFSPDMYDLLDEKKREALVHFGDEFFRAVEKKIVTARTYPPLQSDPISYRPGDVDRPVDCGEKRVLVIADYDGAPSNLAAMVKRFERAIGGPVDTVDLADLNVKGGCLGCIKCGFDNVCAYEGKDDFIPFYNQKVRKADILVFAGAVRDRYLSWRWKQFFDRGFFNTHQPTLGGKQIGLLVSGPLSQIPNLREIFHAYAEWQGANLTCCVTDECTSSEEIDALIQQCAERLVRCATMGYVPPPTFLGVGGMKVFRDDIYGRLRFAFQADHRYYRRYGLYDFPQKDARAKKMNRTMMEMTKDPAMKEALRRKFAEGMVEPLRRVLKRTET